MQPPKSSEKLKFCNFVLNPKIKGAHFRCSSGGRKHGAYCYILSRDVRSWSDARKKCAKIGGALGVIKDEETSLFITNLIRAGRHVSFPFVSFSGPKKRENGGNETKGGETISGGNSISLANQP